MPQKATKAESRTQQERSDRTRRRLLDATIDSLVEFGYARTTTTEVARRAGLSRGAQLHHYPTKAELVVAAVEHLAQRREQELLVEVGRLPEDPDDWIDAGIDLLWSTFSGQLFYAALELWVAARTDQELAAHLYPAERKIGGRIRQLVDEVVPDHIKMGVDVGGVVDFSVHVMRGLALRRLLGPDAQYEQRTIAAWKHHLHQLVAVTEPAD